MICMIRLFELFAARHVTARHGTSRHGIPPAESTNLRACDRTRPTRPDRASSQRQTTSLFHNGVLTRRCGGGTRHAAQNEDFRRHKYPSKSNGLVRLFRFLARALRLLPAFPASSQWQRQLRGHRTEARISGVGHGQLGASRPDDGNLTHPTTLTALSVCFEE